MDPGSWRLDALPGPGFVEVVSPLFEAAPRYLARLEAARPFRSWDRLFAAGAAIALALPELEAIELLDAHPRIGAPPASVSALSFAEQGYGREAGGTDPDDEAERARLGARLGRLNDAYEARFGFRYVIHVAGRPRASIAGLLEASLGRQRDDEMRRGLTDVVAIARDRAATTGLLARFPDGTKEVRT